MSVAWFQNIEKEKSSKVPSTFLALLSKNVVHTQNVKNYKMSIKLYERDNFKLDF